MLKNLRFVKLSDLNNENFSKNKAKIIDKNSIKIKF